MSFKDDLKQQIEKKTIRSITIIVYILFDILVIASIFFGVWVLGHIARWLGMESSYLTMILNQVSEIGFIIMYLILAGWGIIVTYKLFKE